MGSVIFVTITMGLAFICLFLQIASLGLFLYILGISYIALFTTWGE